MAIGPSRKFRSAFSAWIRPLRSWRKPLQWVWGAIILGVIINDGSSWLVAKSFDVSGTPLGWVIEHRIITLAFVSALLLLTCVAGLAHHQAEALTVQAMPQLTLTYQQRLQFIRSFRQEYSNRLAHSLQGRTAIELGLHERTDMVISSAGLVFHHTDTTTEHPLPSGTSIIQVYDQTQRGLLILGVPGSGKTTLLLDLVMELLQRAESNPDHPIPIILNLSLWAEKKLALADWLYEQCALVYSISNRISTLWMKQDQVMFLLDGLDEVEASARAACIGAINRYREEHLVPIVVCSRSQEYGNLQARLILPAAVEIQPLEVAQIEVYLKQAGKSLEAVRKVLRSNTALQQLITTPLLLTIVLLTYRDKAVKDLPQMGSPGDQQRQIFAHYVQYMLERRAVGSDFTSQQTRRWLIWLAKQMEQRHLTEFYLERLQPTWLPTKRARSSFQVFVGLLGGLLAGLPFGLLVGLVAGLIGGLLIGLSVGLSVGLNVGLSNLEQWEIQSTDRLTWNRQQLFVGLLVGPLVGLLTGLLVGESVGPLVGPLVGLVTGLLVGLEFVLLFGLAAGLSGTQVPMNMHFQPNQGIHDSGWNALRVGLVVGLSFGLLVGLAVGLLGGLMIGLMIGLVVGLVIGLISGLGFGGVAYLEHYLLRYVLWRGGAIPKSYVRFLEDANERILLQRVGGGYRFIHPLIQEYFASLATSSATP